MSTTQIESQIEAERLRRRIEALDEENRLLRDLAHPAAGSIELQAETILLQREAAALTDLQARLVPYEGPPPETLEALAALPEPHRRQIAREHPEHVRALQQAEELCRRAEAHDRRLARRREILAGVPEPAALDAMDADQRRDAALAMTAAQRRALAGDVGRADDEAYL